MQSLVPADFDRNDHTPPFPARECNHTTYERLNARELLFPHDCLKAAVDRPNGTHQTTETFHTYMTQMLRERFKSLVRVYHAAIRFGRCPGAPNSPSYRV